MTQLGHTFIYIKVSVTFNIKIKFMKHIYIFTETLAVTQYKR